MFNTDLTTTYQRDLQKVWHGNARMIKYCTDKAAQIVGMENGRYFIIEKKKIRTDFCFGYSLSRYDTEDYDRANAAARHASENADYFIRENMKEITGTLDLLDDDRYMPVLYEEYDPVYGCPNLCALNFRRVAEILEDCGGSAYLEELKGTDKKEARGGRKYHILSGEEKEAVRNAFKEAAARHEKKVLAYLKRYGLSKVNSWSYWRDE